MAAARSALGPVDRRGRPAERHCLSGNCRPAPASRPLRKHAAAARLCAVRVVAVRDRGTGRRHDHRACRGARLARPGCRAAERGHCRGNRSHRRCSLPAGEPAQARHRRQFPVASDPDRLHQRHLDLHPGRPDRARHRRQAGERRAGRPALRNRPPLDGDQRGEPGIGRRLVRHAAAAGGALAGPSRTAGRHRPGHRLVDAARLACARCRGHRPSAVGAARLQPALGCSSAARQAAARRRCRAPRQLRLGHRHRQELRRTDRRADRRQSRADRLRRGQHRRRPVRRPARDRFGFCAPP